MMPADDNKPRLEALIGGLGYIAEQGQGRWCLDIIYTQQAVNLPVQLGSRGRPTYCDCSIRPSKTSTRNAIRYGVCYATTYFGRDARSAPLS